MLGHIIHQAFDNRTSEQLRTDQKVSSQNKMRKKIKIYSMIFFGQKLTFETVKAKSKF